MKNHISIKKLPDKYIAIKPGEIVRSTDLIYNPGKSESPPHKLASHIVTFKDQFSGNYPKFVRKIERPENPIIIDIDNAQIKQEKINELSVKVRTHYGYLNSKKRGQLFRRAAENSNNH